MSIYIITRNCLFIVILFSIISCKKKTEELQIVPLTDYMPLQVGKYITYRLDSTVFTGFGRNTEIHKYQVKHTIDALITDNTGEPAYRVFRSLSDSTGTGSFLPSGSYIIALKNNQVEVIENNLRFIKIHSPIRNGFTWKGNKYLPNEPYSSLYNFSNDDNMGDWEYIIDGEAGSFNYKSQVINDVYTIKGIDETFNIPLNDPSSYAAITRSIEKYAKNIGLVYREYVLWENQPNPTGNPPNVTYDPYKTGFGIKMWMVDHN